MSKRKSSKKWSEKKDRTLIELVNRGLTHRVIALKLKRSKSAIGQRVYYLRRQGVVFTAPQRGRPVTAHGTEPAAVKVAKKVLSKQTKKDTSWMEKDFKKASPKKSNAADVVANYKLASTKLVVYAEMLEKQVASLKKRLAEIEKIVRD